MATRSKAFDMTKGPELRVILMFALPLYLSNILHQVYSLTDISIIGNTLGDNALTAIGSVSTIVDVVNFLMIGMGNGISVAVAKYYGEHDPAKLRKSVYNTILISVAWWIVVTIAGVLALKPLMYLLSVPASVFETAHSYAIIMVSLAGFVFFYNALSGILRGIGNSVIPLVFLIVSVTLNICLDILFVPVLGFGLPGAAVATVIAQACSSFACLIYIIRKVPELHLTKQDMKADAGMISEIFSAGLSFALMFSVVSVGTVILQKAINGLGDDIIAAHTTARKISSLCMMTISTLGSAIATFAGQNHGAGRYDRIRKGMRHTLMLSFAIAAVLVLFIYTLGEFMVKTISGSSNDIIISSAVYYLRFDLPFYFVLAILLIARSALQGVGAKITPVIASVMELLLKAFTAGYLVKRFAYFGVALCEPVIWCVCAIFILIVLVTNRNIRGNKSSVS